jgi:GTP-binding protein EngB required for normal cell division
MAEQRDAQLGAMLRRSRHLNTEALRRTQPRYAGLIDTLNATADEIGGIRTSVGHTSEASRKVAADLETLALEVKNVLESSLRETTADLSAAWRRLSEHDGSLTVAVFGRTRSGKSTLMEALTKGDGAAIGRGRQHTTTDVNRYTWPPGEGLLHVVDTPGIEGFKGAELAQKAQEFVQAAHLLLYVLSDDAIGAEVIDQFAQIQRLEKPVVFILNIKSSLEMLEDSPEEVFAERTIQGHIQQLQAHLKDSIPADEIEVIPIHALAAHRSTRGGDDAEHYRQLSRVVHVEERLRRFLRDEALTSSMHAPRAPVRAKLSELTDSFERLVASTAAATESLAARRSQISATLSEAVPRLEGLVAAHMVPFEGVDGEIEPLVDEVIASGGDGRALAERWQQLLERKGVAATAAGFEAEARRDLEEAIRGRVAADGLGAGYVGNGPIHGLLLDDARQRNDAYIAQRWFSIATKVVAIGAAVAASVFIDPMAGPVVQRAADELETQIAGMRGRNARWVGESRDTIVADLRERLRLDRERIEKGCRSWLADASRTVRDDLLSPLASADAWLAAIRDALCDGRDRLRAHQVALFHDMVEHTLDVLIPEVSAREIDLDRAYWCPSGAAIIRVRAQRPALARPAVFLEGVGGGRRREIVGMLGVREVTLLDTSIPPERQIEQCLSPWRCTAALSQTTEGRRRARVIAQRSVRHDERILFEARLVIAREMGAVDEILVG